MWNTIKYWWFKIIKRKRIITDNNGEPVTDNSGEFIWEDE